jgi:DNA polymerase-1
VVRHLREVYPPLLAAGVRIRRAHDLLLCHAILRDTASLADPVPPSSRWIRSDPLATTIAMPALFDLHEVAPPESGDPFAEVDELLAEYARQRALWARTGRPPGTAVRRRVDRALVAEEMTAAACRGAPRCTKGCSPTRSVRDRCSARGPRGWPSSRP